MSGKDFFYPLPKKDLLRRYKPVFEAISQGNSVTQWGFSNSANYAFLKFVFSQQDLLDELLQVDKHIPEFLFLDFDSLPKKEAPFYQMHLLAQVSELILRSKISDPDLNVLLSQAESAIDDENGYICLKLTVELLKNAFEISNLRIVIVIHDFAIERWEEVWGRNLYKLWQVRRIHPDNRVSFVFLTPPYLVPDQLPGMLRPLQMAYFEKTYFFPLLDQTETEYTLKRMESIYGEAIPEEYRTWMYEVLGGFYDNFLPVLKDLKRTEGFSERRIKKYWLANKMVRANGRYLLGQLPREIGIIMLLGP